MGATRLKWFTLQATIIHWQRPNLKSILKKQQVLAEKKRWEEKFKENDAALDPILNRAAGQRFHN